MSVRTIATAIKLAGEKEFNDGMKAMNSNLKTLKSDMAAVSSEYDDNANSAAALSKKQKILEESVAQHQAKVDALRQKYEQVAEAYGENSAQADKYKQQLNQATVALNKETAALEKNKEALHSVRNPIKNVIASYRGLVDRLADAKDGMDEFAEKQKKAGELISKATKPITFIPSIAGKATVGFTKMGAAAIAAGAATGTVLLTSMVSFAKEAAEAAKAAQEAGETLTETQQQWLEYSGQLDALDASVANAKSALAGVLLPVLRDLSTEGEAFLNDFSRDMNAAAGDTAAQTQVLTDYIVKGVELIKEKLPEYVAMGKELFSGLGEGLSEAGPEILDMGIDVVMDLLDGILGAAPQLAEAGISMIRDQLLPGMISRGPDAVASGVAMVSQILSGLAQAAPQLIPMATTLVIQLVTALIENAPQLLSSGLEFVLAVIAGIIMGFGELAMAAYDIVLKLQEGFEDKVDTFHEMGGNVIEFIKKGISDAWNGLVTWFNNLWDNLFMDRNVDVNVNASGSGPDGSHASGLNYVPFDGYLARLHRGEMVLTSEQAARYRAGGQVTKNFHLTINTKSLNESDINMLIEIVNRKLGEDL